MDVGVHSTQDIEDARQAKGVGRKGVSHIIDTAGLWGSLGESPAGDKKGSHTYPCPCHVEPGLESEKPGEAAGRRCDRPIVLDTFRPQA